MRCVPAVTIAEEKAALRRRQMARREQIGAAADGAGEAARDAFLASYPADLLKGAGCVSLFATFGSEIDTEPLARALDRAGVQLCLPVVVARGRPLAFRTWRPDDPLLPDGLGVPTPLPTAAPALPGFVVCPLLAFDREGYRLGYGAGYYDITLAALRARRPVPAIGFAFAAQEVESVPHDGDDQRLDAVATEAGIIHCGQG